MQHGLECGENRMPKKSTSTAKEEKKFVWIEKKNAFAAAESKYILTHTKPYQHQQGFCSTMQNRLSQLHATDPIFAVFTLFPSLTVSIPFFVFFPAIPNEKNRIKYSTNTSSVNRMTSQMKTFPLHKLHTHMTIFIHLFSQWQQYCSSFRFGSAKMKFYRIDISCKLISLMLIACALDEFSPFELESIDSKMCESERH